MKSKLPGQGSSEMKGGNCTRTRNRQAAVAATAGVHLAQVYILSVIICSLLSSIRAEVGSFGEGAGSEVAEELRRRMLQSGGNLSELQLHWSLPNPTPTVGTSPPSSPSPLPSPPPPPPSPPPVDTPGPGTLPPGYGNRPPAWHGRFDPVYGRSYFAPSLTQNHCAKHPGRNCSMISELPELSYPYEQYIMDPTNSTDPGPVLKVWYPAGAWAAASTHPSGTLFYAFPFKYNPHMDKGDPFSQHTATLEYEVYFPSDFQFVQGGKLPGFASTEGCGGGANPADCFSFRIMWRGNGYGEAYIYAPHYMQASDFCTSFQKCWGVRRVPCTECNYNAGVSMGRGTFQFQRGQWNKITMTLGLNTPNVTDGLLEIQFNNQLVLRYDKMNWRQYPNVVTSGIIISSWFGGGDSSWAPTKDMYALFRNFRAWRNDPPTVPSASTGAMATALSYLPYGQVVITKEIKEAD